MQIQFIVLLVIVLNSQAAVFNKNFKYDAQLRDSHNKDVPNEDRLIKINRENHSNNKAQVIKKDTDIIDYETEKNIAEKDEEETQKDHTLDADGSKTSPQRDGSLNLHKSAEVQRNLAGNVIDLDSTEDENALAHRVKRDVEWIWSNCPDGEHYDDVGGRLVCVKNQDGSEFFVDSRFNFGNLNCPGNTRALRIGRRVQCVGNLERKPFRDLSFS